MAPIMGLPASAPACMLSSVAVREGEPDEGGLTVDEVPATILDSTPGDAIVFDFRLWHGSWKGGVDRRMFSLQYFKNPKTPSERAAMQAHVQGAVDQVRSSLCKSNRGSTECAGVAACCCLGSCRRFGLIASSVHWTRHTKPTGAYCE